MNILYIITGLGIGGAEKVTVDLANLMQDKGNNVAILYLYGDNQYTSLIYKSIFVKGLSMSKTPKSFYLSLIKAREILKKFRPDVVHAQMFHANIFARFLRFFYKIPLLICTEHSKNIESKIRMRLYQITDFLSDVNTNVSREATEYFISHHAFSDLKSFPMYNGIYLEKFEKSNESKLVLKNKIGLENNEFVFLNVGRLVQAKDQTSLLLAFSDFLKTYKLNAKLVIVGEGPLRDNLCNYINNLDIRENVILAGFHSNVSEYYTAADCFVLSSLWEGFGIVLAEAMSCGLPVITTDAGGCREVVEDSRFVISLQNPQEITLKMKEIFDMSLEERDMLGNMNSIRAKKFDINIIGEKWTQIYSLFSSDKKSRNENFTNYNS